jgi:hypothetical protein
MDTLPADMICEIVSHVEGEDLVKFSMINKRTYDILDSERKKFKDIVRQKAVKLNKMAYDTLLKGRTHYEDTSEELFPIDDLQIRCLGCFKSINLIE